MFISVKSEWSPFWNFLKCVTSRMTLVKGILQHSFTISLRSTLFTLAKQSRQLGAYKLARYAYDKLQVSWELKPNWYDTVSTPNDNISILKM